NQIECSLIIDKENLLSEIIKAQPQWLEKFASAPLSLASDADFKLDVTWAGWRAPGKINNADNLVFFSKKDFKFKHYHRQNLADGTVELELFFEGRHNPFELQITYRLEPQSFFIRRRLALQDSKGALHFLRWLWPRDGYISGALSIIKEGGFGQPAAVNIGQGGAFFGLEFPTAENWLKKAGNHKFKLSCGQVIGKKIASTWLKSEWTVVALTPETRVKQWFWKYVDKIRAAPLRPYLLYNSWYDLRSPEMVKDQARAMTEKNVLRTIASFKKRLLEERNLKLDAFVLDDGWDIYRSDWCLNKGQFPHGLSPLAEALQAMDCQLGLWLGPIGGYSHRTWRVDWMKAHGYEVVGDQMCVAGEHYHQLLKKRVTDFVGQDHVSYFKWDGIQFTCNQPDHGHLPDIYSRRAVMEAIIDLCRSVRTLKPDIFLNITSGTWLSPWWLKYANTIWMQGYDYGYANVPSLTRRDRAMTYRDSVLFDDLVKFDFWFPIANLMTHGIIKGHLNQLGGANEPLEKFADNAVLYFARGISMWELYISPDFLTEKQWDILAGAIRWAKDRFPLLCSTEMVGGDPDERQAYGYVHFSGEYGLIAVRNPYIEHQSLFFKLSPELGIDDQAEPLVLERIYPDCWVSPQLYKTGSVIKLPLQGYETAIYELYPLREASLPLVAGRKFSLKPVSSKD
ncbi:MAG: alpha-galactosidase, partial [Candidatus Aminicenantales bacterium]